MHDRISISFFLQLFLNFFSIRKSFSSVFQIWSLNKQPPSLECSAILCHLFLLFLLYLLVSTDLPQPVSCHVPVHSHLAQKPRASAKPAASTFTKQSRACSLLPTWLNSLGKTEKNTTVKRTEKTLASLETINGFCVSCRASGFSTPIKQQSSPLCLKKDSAHRVNLEKAIVLDNGTETHLFLFI